MDSELQKLGGDSSHLQSSTVDRETMLLKVTTEAEYHLESSDLETRKTHCLLHVQLLATL